MSDLTKLERESRECKRYLKGLLDKFRPYQCSLEELYAAFERENPTNGISGSDAIVLARRQEREKYNTQ